MNFKKILAAVAAAAMSVGIMATTAMAASLDGEVELALYLGESATWVTGVSESQVISQTGEYTFKLDGYALAPASLNVIYVKDVAVENFDDDKSNINPDVQIITKSLKINGTEMALTDGYNTTITDNGYVDVCWYNIWADSFVNLDSITEINDVEVTIELSLGGAPAAGTDTAGGADTGVAPVAALAVATLAGAALVATKKR